MTKKIKKIKLPGAADIFQVVDSGSVRFDEAQSLTSDEKTQVKNNIGISDVPTISTNVATDASSDTKTVSPKAVKTYVDNLVSTAYKAAGSTTFANLPVLEASLVGNVYNVTTDFTTTTDFLEGEGKYYPAGTNVVIVKSGEVYKYDVLAGSFNLSSYVPTTRKVNGKELDKDITLNASDVGAAATSHTHDNYVPTTRTVNGKALSENISLTSTDVGAASSSHTHTYSSLTGKPTIPTKTSELTNDSGFITDISGKVDKVTGKGLSTNDLTDTLKSNYDSAYTHSQATHAPSDAEKNTIVGVQKNGIDVSINSTTRKVNITVPTKVSDLTNDSGYTTNTGTVTSVSVKMNNTIEGTVTSSGTIDLGTVITAHQDISGKVDKVTGKGLSTNDLTDELKGNYDAAYTHSQATHARTDATKVESSTTNGNIKINGTETTVYTHPSGTNPHGTTKSDVGLGNVTNNAQVKGLSSGTTADHVVTWGSDGYTVKDSGFTIGKSVPSDAKFTDTVYTHPGSGTNPHGTTKSDVGLGNVGNFKAVSTVASQGLTDIEKSNARANIGAGTSSLTIGTTSTTAAAGNHTHGYYTKPSDGIPKTDLASAVQTSLGKADTALQSHQDISGKANLASPALTGTPTAPTAGSGTNTTQIATTAFVQSAIDTKIAAADAMIYKGTIGTGGTVTALPNTTAKTGWTYKVLTAGTYDSKVCEIGDMIICLTDGSSSTNATWTVVQNNIDGAVTGPASAVDAQVAVFNGTSGKVIKDSGYTIATSVPANAVFTDTNTWRPLGTGANDAAAGNHTHGYYTKPSDGIPKTDLASAVQTSLGKADSALQSHQDISGKQDKSTAVTHTASTAVGSATKGVYIASDGTATAMTYSVSKDVPSNAVFTDTNTWRGIQNNLTSDSTSDSLSAAQGKALKGLVDGKAASSHTHNYAGSSSAGGSATSSDAIRYYTATLLTSGWTTSGSGKSQTVSCSGMTSDMTGNFDAPKTEHNVDADIDKALQKGLKILCTAGYSITAGSDTITWYIPGTTVPSIDIPVYLSKATTR